MFQSGRRKVLLIQLPVPKLNFGLLTGNIPLAAACLCQAAAGLPGCEIQIFPETLASYGGDETLIRAVVDEAPDIIGFTVFSWNLERSLYLTGKIKEKIRPRIIFGGPEITPDNPLVRSPLVDMLVFGEGEAVLRALLTQEALWEKRELSDDSDASFFFKESPYVDGFLLPSKENPVLIETQRGCPYRCGFCYYNKSRKTRSMATDDSVLRGVAFAIEKGVKEVYLLDPSLNSRPGLASLLKQMAALNHEEKVSFISEIRAESVDETMAGLFRKAGFKEFEVGLQSTNPKALKKMNRPTDLKKFLSGVRALQKEGIAPIVDLIFGLPGDTLEGFGQTLDFVSDNAIDSHLQVFPLLVLPGTDFRKKSRELGLMYDPSPPYTLIRSPGFSALDMQKALDMAEEKFDTSFCLFPDLELSFKEDERGGDLYIDLEGRQCLAKLILESPRDLRQIEVLACRITSPFQIFFGPGSQDRDFQKSVVSVVSRQNPFVPLEIIFMEPKAVPDTRDLLCALHTKKPHFLDQDLRYLYPEPGDRAVQFTLVSKHKTRLFEGEMKRQVFLFDGPDLPEKSDLESLSFLDGVLINTLLPFDRVKAFQDRILPFYEEMPPLSFAHTRLQMRWMRLTASKAYDVPLLCRISGQPARMGG